MGDGTVIARGGLNLRTSPRTGRIVKSLRRSSKVEVLGQETWLRVRTRDGLEGFVLADFIELDPATIFFNAPDEQVAAPEPSARPASKTASSKLRLRTYSNSRFIGETLRVDADFFPALDRLNVYAEDCGVEIYVTSSIREPRQKLRGTIVPPASRSNHLVGHALDVNLKSKSGFFNSRKLAKKHFGKLPKEIRRFIGKVRKDAELRWGGDFRPEDPVHIDDGLYQADAALWKRKLASRA